MPVVQFHLVENQLSAAECESLVRQASAFFATALEAPLERIRVFINFYAPYAVAVAGEPISQSQQTAPYFECIVLASRTKEQRHYIMQGLTALLVEATGADIKRVRGYCRRVDPDDWYISGEPASLVRQAEIQSTN